MRVIAVYSIKGGVGKTASAVNLAHLSAAAGARTLIWDLDPQGASTFYFRVKPKLRGGSRKLLRGKRKLDRFIRGTDYEDLDLLPADFDHRHLDLALDAAGKPRKRLGKRIRPLAGEYDHLYIDCAPSISLVSESVFQAADALLVPVIPTTLSLLTYQQLLDFLEGHRIFGLEMMPFFSMVDRRKRMHLDVMESLPDTRRELLSTRIPYASDVEKMGIHRMPVGGFAPHCPASKAYEQLWKEVQQRMV